MADEISIAEMIEENDAAEAEAARIDRLDVLGGTLSKLASEQISLRRDIEDRWLDDMRQHAGRYDAVTEANLKEDKTKSRVFVNITRAKTNAAEARLGDMLLPTDDKNWGMKPTPVADIDNNIGDQTVITEEGDTASELAMELQEEAKKRAKAMEREIDDQLKEAQYNQECRKVIHSKCLLGTGILKGPVIVGKSRKSWKQVKGKDKDGQEISQYVLTVQDVLRPDAAWVDPWNFFPDMSAAVISDAEFIFERSYMSRRQVRELLKRPGFLESQIKVVLASEPGSFRLDDQHMARIREINGVPNANNDRKYEVWSYNGPIEKDDLKACGCNVDEDDVLEQYEGIVWFIGNKVIKAAINPLDSGEFMYSVVNWTADESCIFGFGVPYELRNPQKVINASWRMTLENAGLSTGPQIVYNKAVIAPADGDWRLRPRKEWHLTDRNVPVSNAFATFEISSHQNELMAIFESARKLADEETSLPMIAQGGEQRSGMTPTLGGLSMMMNSSNVVLRRTVKQYDDGITVPTIGRFFDWNMQYNPKEEIKGDHEIDARGSSALLVKELQAQSLLQWMNYANSPTFAPAIKAPALLRKIAQVHHLSAEEMVKTDGELREDAEKARQNQPEDPIVMRAKASLEETKYKMDMTHRMNQERLAMQERELEVRRMESELNFKTEVMKLMNDKDMSGDQIKAHLAAVAMKVTADQDKHADKLIMDAIKESPDGIPGEEQIQ